jgi:hypothetical protein
MCDFETPKDELKVFGKDYVCFEESIVCENNFEEGCICSYCEERRKNDLILLFVTLPQGGSTFSLVKKTLCLRESLGVMIEIKERIPSVEQSFLISGNLLELDRPIASFNFLSNSRLILQMKSQRSFIFEIPKIVCFFQINQDIKLLVSCGSDKVKNLKKIEFI